MFLLHLAFQTLTLF
jgi:ribosomal protein L18